VSIYERDGQIEQENRKGKRKKINSLLEKKKKKKKTHTMSFTDATAIKSGRKRGEPRVKEGLTMKTTG
jgi:hypothetical protein